MSSISSMSVYLLCALCISVSIARPQNNNNWFGSGFPNFPQLQPQPQQQQQGLADLFIDTTQQQQQQQQPQLTQQQSQGDSLLRTTPATPTTASPQYLQCLRTCPSTMEYNPLCGSDGEDYQNTGRLQCANFCGRTVTALRMGTCEPL